MANDGEEGRKRPEWVPERDDAHHGAYASEVLHGIESPMAFIDAETARQRRQKRRKPDLAELEAGIRQGDRTLLSRAITLVESRSPVHESQAQDVLSRILAETGRSIRIGITGTPGAGKSTFIEALGNRLCDRGHRVAVLAIDPSSSVTGGSILGDKTRMETLARRPEAFIRPSPASGTLGGVARKTREILLLCEAAGFDVVIVETVGVGQSETSVRSMVDMFLLLQIAGGGDELQGIKKGVIELADAIVVNKADGENKSRAQSARAEYARVLRFLQPATPGWKPRALTCSAMSGEGVEEVWELVLEFVDATKGSGTFQRRRREQALSWFHSLLEEAILQRFRQMPYAATEMPRLERAVLEGSLPAARAAQQLVEAIFDRSNTPST